MMNIVRNIPFTFNVYDLQHLGISEFDLSDDEHCSKYSVYI